MKQLGSKIAAWYRGTSNAFKAGINTAWQAFIATFAVTLFGFLSDLSRWADGSADLPSISPIAKTFVSAIVALASGLVAVVFRNIKPGPQYEGSTQDRMVGGPPEGG